MDTIQSKTCTKCGADKPLTEFYKGKRGKHGRIARCIECVTRQQHDRQRQQLESAPPGALKACNTCGDIKRVEDFYAGVGRYGRRPRCKACEPEPTDDRRKAVREASRFIRTGFSHQDFAHAVNAQENCCAICHAEFSLLPARAVHADHDHLTGERRGVLCRQCNRLLGLANDSTKLLRRAAEYLENPPLRGVL